LAHEENRRPAKAGTGASRWIRMSFSVATRTSRFRSDALAIGAAGVPRRPRTVGRVMMRSRSGTPSRCLSLLRAWALISAIFTPCGQTWVQIPQPEQ
jgi:hypothetical protein